MLRDAKFFTHPTSDWQRRYEALRASFVERRPAKVVADRFRYTTGYVHLLRHQFRTGKLDLGEPPPEGKAARRRISGDTRQKIRAWREQRLSVGEIAQLLSEAGVEVSVATVARVLAEEGFERLPRRTGLKAGVTVAGAQVPEKSEAISLAELDGHRFESEGAGVFLFAPFLAQLGLAAVVREARLPGTKAIPALNYLLSFLALKLIGTERYAHVGEHSFDPGLGLFAGLNVLPKCTAMSTYSFGLDEVHINRLQSAFVRHAIKLGLYDGKVVNLDFHSIPHFGEDSVLEKHWTGARGKGMKGALTLFAQDAESKLLLYTAADIRRVEADDQVTDFLDFWRRVWRGASPKFVFDARFTSYPKLSELNAAGIKFITLRRRGAKLLRNVEKLEGWLRIHVPHAKRKYPNPQVHESQLALRGYDGELRQLIVRGNGHEKPSFLITNDHDADAALIVGDYARRWRVENGIAEAVKFFNLNALSSPILTKIHFDVVLTAIADTLYTMLARKLRGHEDCHAPKLFRNFVAGKGTVRISGSKVEVSFPRRAHNPILRDAPWRSLPSAIPSQSDAKLELKFA
jgi:transposase